MQQLIKINTDTNGINNVSARELYDVLGYDKSQWKRWYTKNIIDNQFAIENTDWVGFDIMSSSNNGSQTMDFAITVDFAKKLSMLARTKKGDEVRDYFLECERQSQKPQQDLLNLSKLEILQMAIESEQGRIKLAEEKKQLEAENAKLSPKAEYTDKVLQSETTMTATEVAKSLGLSALRLNEILCDRGIQYKHRKHYVLSAKYQNKGYAKLVSVPYIDADGKPNSRMQLEWTEYGRVFINQQLNSALSFYNPIQQIAIA
jgi:anti-repressor protein